jgi:hypothetical protein
MAICGLRGTIVDMKKPRFRGAASSKLDALRSRHRSRALGGRRRRSQMIQLFVIEPIYGGAHSLSTHLWLQAAHTTRLGLTQTTTLGESLIRNLIPYELGGTVDSKFRPEGAYCKSKFVSMRESEARAPGYHTPGELDARAAL